MSEKLFYRIGEACKRLDIQPYVLRYWETEFPFLIPSKSSSGQRVYGEAELAIIQRIKELLYEEGYTIAGAKKKLESELAKGQDPPAGSSKSPTSKDKVPSNESGTAAEQNESRGPLGGDEEITKLRSGIEGAVSKAREIIELLSD